MNTCLRINVNKFPVLSGVSAVATELVDILSLQGAALPAATIAIEYLGDPAKAIEILTKVIVCPYFISYTYTIYDVLNTSKLARLRAFFDWS
jgi:hypothetical protein